MCKQKGITTCAIVQGTLVNEHMHIINKNDEWQLAQGGALMHTLWLNNILLLVAFLMFMLCLRFESN